MDFTGKKIVVMGLGTLGGGEGTARFLAKRGADVVVTDLRNKDKLKSSLKNLSGYGIRFVLGKHREEDFRNAEMVIKNPAVPSNSPFLDIARKNNIPVEMAESLFMKLSPTQQIIGITGTRGKSTTSAMIYEILKKAGKKVFLGGNVKNRSTLEILDEVDFRSIVVLELSSWMLESFGWNKLSPHIAVITNIYPDHLNRYSSMDSYIADKKNIFKFQKENDYLLLNKHDPRSKEFAANLKSRIIWYGKNNFQVEISLPGDHNKVNAAAALQVADLLKIPRKTSLSAVSLFKGLPYRLETIATINGVTFINDSASTTPIAGVTAIAAFSGKPIILIAGGNSKNIPLDEYIDKIRNNVKSVVLFEGTAFGEFRHINGYIGPLKLTQIQETVNEAWKRSKPGDVVLFSPGVTHLPVLNEFERGDLYTNAVKSLQKKENN